MHDLPLILRPSSSQPVLVLGHGLAGASVAWQLHWLGLPFVVVDEEAELTSSKIAAGLLTPITGMRLALSPDHAAELGACAAFHRKVSRELGRCFMHVRSHVRLLSSAKEKQLWQKRLAEGAVQRFLAPLRPLSGYAVAEDVEGLQMRQGGWVDTAGFLQASRSFWQSLGRWQSGRVELAQALSAVGKEWSGVIDCRGWNASRCAAWDWLPWECMKGTILDLAADLGGEKRILHHGCWIAPQAPGLLRAGATYSRDLRQPHDAEPAQLQELLGEISQNIAVPWQVVAVRTGVRPILSKQRAVLGWHPGRPGLAVLNGLGSKGALRAPRLAAMLLRHLLEAEPLPAVMDARGNF
jgi:glycine oxidase